jgi:hypothetical protein
LWLYCSCVCCLRAACSVHICMFLCVPACAATFEKEEKSAPGCTRVCGICACNEPVERGVVVWSAVGAVCCPRWISPGARLVAVVVDHQCVGHPNPALIPRPIGGRAVWRVPSRHAVPDRRGIRWRVPARVARVPHGRIEPEHALPHPIAGESDGPDQLLQSHSPLDVTDTSALPRAGDTMHGPVAPILDVVRGVPRRQAPRRRVEHGPDQLLPTSGVVRSVALWGRRCATVVGVCVSRAGHRHTRSTDPRVRHLGGGGIQPRRCRQPALLWVVRGDRGRDVVVPPRAVRQSTAGRQTPRLAAVPRRHPVMPLQLESTQVVHRKHRRAAVASGGVWNAHEGGTSPRGSHGQTKDELDDRHTTDTTLPMVSGDGVGGPAGPREARALGRSTAGTHGDTSHLPFQRPACLPRHARHGSTVSSHRPLCGAVLVLVRG